MDNIKFTERQFKRYEETLCNMRQSLIGAEEAAKNRNSQEFVFQMMAVMLTGTAIQRIVDDMKDELERDIERGKAASEFPSKID